MKEEQEGGGKVEEKESKRRKVGIMTKLAMTLGVVKKANASADDNGACSDGGSEKDECSGSKRIGAKGRTECRGSSEKGSFCNGSRSGKELLCLRRF